MPIKDPEELWLFQTGEKIGSGEPCPCCHGKWKNNVLAHKIRCDYLRRRNAWLKAHGQ